MIKFSAIVLSLALSISLVLADSFSADCATIKTDLDVKKCSKGLTQLHSFLETTNPKIEYLSVEDAILLASALEPGNELVTYCTAIETRTHESKVMRELLTSFGGFYISVQQLSEEMPYRDLPLEILSRRYKQMMGIFPSAIEAASNKSLNTGAGDVGAG